MLFRRFAAFLLLFAISQIPLAVAFVIREWDTVSEIVSADSARFGDPAAAPEGGDSFSGAETEAPDPPKIFGESKANDLPDTI